MGALIWTGLFLLLTVVGSMVGAAALIGMPISGEVQIGVITMVAAVAASGAFLRVRSRAQPSRPR